MATVSDPSARKTGRKFSRKFVYRAVFCSVVLGLLLFLYLRDDSLQDFSDLERVIDPRAKRDAVFDAWQTAIDLVDSKTQWNEQRSDRTLRYRLEGKFTWRQEPVDRILSANGDAIDAIVKADALGAFQFSPYRYADMSEVVELLRLDAITRHRAGDHESAVEKAAIGLRVGDRAIIKNDGIVGVNECNYWNAIALSAFEILIHPDLPEESLHAIDKILAAEPDMESALNRALRIRFHHWRRAIRNGSDVDNLSAVNWVRGLQHKPNRTINFAADHYRKALVAVSTDYEHRHFPVPPEAPQGLQRLSKNAFGQEQLSRVLPDKEWLFSKTNHQLAYRRALRLKIAVLRHTKDKGRPPASVSSLVPDYLDEALIDPYDGKPLRYDSTRVVIWSVSEDEVDGGGATRPTYDSFGVDRYDDLTLWINPPEPGPAPLATE